MKLRYFLRFFVLIFSIQLLLSACGGGDGTFRLNGHIEGFGTGNLRVVYFDNGAVQNVTATAVDGNFGVDARAKAPVMVRLYTGNGRMLGAFNASPGESLDATFKLNDPAAMQVSGNDDAERISAFLSANADALRNGNHQSLNKAIANYANQNPNRNVSGTLLASYFYLPGNEAEAIEIASQLGEKVRRTASLQGLIDIAHRQAIPTDSLRIEPFTVADNRGHQLNVNPTKSSVTLLMFTDSDTRTSDSIASLISHYAASDSLTTQIVDISIDADTATWQTSLRDIAESDTISAQLRSALRGVKRAWSPAPYSIMGLDAIAVACTPWFVVADSTTRILYSGPRASSAQSMAKF